MILVALGLQVLPFAPFLIDFHWPPVKHSIEFKILLFIFKCPSGEGPSDQTSMLHSAAQCLLREPHVAGPGLWNALPIGLKLCPSDSVDAPILMYSISSNGFPLFR